MAVRLAMVVAGRELLRRRQLWVRLLLTTIRQNRGDMRIYGYADTGQPFDTVAPALLAEITLNATPDELRALAEFLRGCADEMDRMGDSFDHVHLSDRQRQFETSPHFVVARG